MKRKEFLLPLTLTALAAGSISIVSAASPEKSGDCCSASAEQSYEIFLADPTVFADNGKYYMSGTRDSRPAGFTLLESDNLRDWHYARPDSLILLRGRDTFGAHGFWAPQIFKDGDRYLFAYCAEEQIAIADSPEIDGIYTQSVIEPVDGSQHNIDPFIFKDDDGKYYFYHVRFGGGNYLWGAEWNPETRKLVDGTLQKCFVNTQPWEKTDAYPCAPIMEGPTLVKLGGVYYLFYSANHFLSPDYAVGYAYAPTPLGPWTKYEGNPVINSSIAGELGSGHGDIFYDNDGAMRYVYHIHNRPGQATPRRTRIITLNVDKSQGHPYRIPADPATILVPHLTR